MIHKDCKAKDEKEYGYGLVCIIHFQKEGYGEYQCLACGRVWDIADSGKLPDDILCTREKKACK